jgi:hypothetical protein
MLKDVHSLPDGIAHADGSGSEGPGLKYLADVLDWAHGASVEENEETHAFLLGSCRCQYSVFQYKQRPKSLLRKAY